jgi:thiol-disulfide isomerase/thioredoxin
MRLPAIALLLVIVLALGCAQSGQPSAAAQAAPGAGNGTLKTGNQPAEPEPPMHIKETNISREIRGDIMTTDTKFPERPHFDFINTTNASGSWIVYYFYSPRCGACVAFKPEYERIKAEFDNFEWREIDITNANGSLAYDDYVAQWNLSPKQMYTPQVLVNGTIITDRFNISATLPSLLENLTIG